MKEERPRVVLIHRYFSPDTPPYAHILERIAARLGADGCDVTVLTCQPSYRPEHSGRVASTETREWYRVVRWSVIPDRRYTPLRAVNLVVFCLRLIFARRHFTGADVVMAATTPPVLVAAVASVIARIHGARFIYHKQDIYPEVLAPERQLAAWGRLLRSIDARTERRSSSVVVLSTDMAATVRARHTSELPIEVINNFDPWPLQLPSDLSGPHGDRLVVVFAGNQGRFQGIDAVIDLVRMVVDAPIDFHFFGDGVRSGDIAALEAECSNVVVHGYRPPTEVAEFVRTRADLGLVSLEMGVIRAAYPSKTMTYLRNGCPLLLVMEEESELSRMTITEEIGVAGSCDNLRGLADMLSKLAACPNDVRSMRPGVDRVYRERFTPDVLLSMWSNLVNRAVAS